MQSLLPFLVATVVGPASPATVPVYDLAALTDAEARRLAGRRALFRVVLDGEPDGDPQDGWRYDCRGDGPDYCSLWLPDGDDLVATKRPKAAGCWWSRPHCTASPTGR